MEHYSTTIVLNTTPAKVFSAVTNEITSWWTTLFKGRAKSNGDEFTVRFGDNIFKTMEVMELSDGIKIVWRVKDSLIGIPGFRNQKEWIGTTIIWEIVPGEINTGLKLTHIGLKPGVECYAICTAGWQQFLNSLKTYLETAKGNPYKA